MSLHTTAVPSQVLVFSLATVRPHRTPTSQKQVAGAWWSAQAITAAFTMWEGKILTSSYPGYSSKLMQVTSFQLGALINEASCPSVNILLNGVLIDLVL